MDKWRNVFDLFYHLLPLIILLMKRYRDRSR